MHNHIKLILTGISLAICSTSYAGSGNEKPVIPCDQPGANPGGSTAMDHSLEPCNVGVPNDVGNTSVTGPDAPKNRLSTQSETKQLPPPHNPDPQAAPRDR